MQSGIDGCVPQELGNLRYALRFFRKIRQNSTPQWTAGWLSRRGVCGHAWTRGKAMTKLEQIAEKHIDYHTDPAILAALRELREELAKLAEQDSLVSWIGGSTGNGPMTADRIAAAIRAFGEEDDDPTPWCHQCSAQTPEACKCGPIAENN